MTTGVKASPKKPWTPRRVLVTPEGVDLGADLAPLGARFGALVIDLVILAAGLWAFFWLIALVFFTTRSEKPPEVGLIILNLGFFIARNTWFIFWEMTPGAATLGKRILRIRVAMRNGGRLTADAIFARNVTRELELFLPIGALLSAPFAAAAGGLSGWVALALLIWILIFALIPRFNADRLRAGDLIAGTWVVQAPRETLQPDLAHGGQATPYAFAQAQLDAYGVMELQVLETVLRRMDKQVLRDVALRIRIKIGWTSIAAEDDATFLKAYYAALRDRLEKRLLFGHRRKDKHDREGLR